MMSWYAAELQMLKEKLHQLM